MTERDPAFRAAGPDDAEQVGALPADSLTVLAEDERAWPDSCT